MHMPIAAIAGAIVIVALAIWWVRLRLSGSGQVQADSNGSVDNSYVQSGSYSDPPGDGHGFGDTGGGDGS